MFSAVFGASQWIHRSDVALGYVTLVRPHVANFGGGEARVTFSCKIVKSILTMYPPHAFFKMKL